MPKIIADSDILSDLLRNGNVNVTAHAKKYTEMHRVLTFTSFSALEILSGLRHIQANSQLQRAEILFSRNDEICPEIDDYRLAAEIIGALLRAGTPIGFIDPSIAACAIRRGYGVASANAEHYGFILNLGYRFHFENWREA